MFHLVMSMMESDSSGGWGGSGGGYYPEPEPGPAEARLEQAGELSGNSLASDLIEVEITDPAVEMERLCRRAMACLENGHEAALETEMLRQHLETCKLQGTALKPVLLQSITRVLSAAQLGR